MKFKTVGYALIVAVAAVAVSIGSADAKYRHKKKAAAPPPPPPAWCPYTAPQPVCGSLKGHKFTYNDACFAAKDGAKVVANHACPVKKAHKAKKAKKYTKKKAAKKKPAKKY